jgi:hypothetical protein
VGKNAKLIQGKWWFMDIWKVNQGENGTMKRMGRGNGWMDEMEWGIVRKECAQKGGNKFVGMERWVDGFWIGRGYRAKM